MGPTMAPIDLLGYIEILFDFYLFYRSKKRLRILKTGDQKALADGIFFKFQCVCYLQESSLIVQVSCEHVSKKLVELFLIVPCRTYFYSLVEHSKTCRTFKLSNLLSHLATARLFIQNLLRKIFHNM